MIQPSGVFIKTVVKTGRPLLMVFFYGAVALTSFQSACASQDSSPSDALVIGQMSGQDKSAPGISEVVSESKQDRWKRAIANDQVELLEQMWLESGKNPLLQEVRSENGKNALMIACKTGADHFFEALLAAGLEPDSSTATGGTPLMFATLGNRQSIVARLIELGVDTDSQGSNGWSSMTIAAAKGYRDLVAFLASAGADINATDVYGWTPIMRAVDNGHLETVLLMSSMNAIDLDNQDESGNTALHHAVAQKQLEMVKQLIAKGASTTLPNGSGVSPHQLAIAGPGSEELRSLFKD